MAGLRGTEQTAGLCASHPVLHSEWAGNPAGEQKEQAMSLADLCMLLGLLIAFGTLVLKVVEVARKD